MKIESLATELSKTTYPGRGIVIGKSADGKYAVTAYFIMGRSENSRNRVFVEDGEGIRTQAFDPSKMKDPSLIIYAPVRVLGNNTIVTNGDQTDTVYDLMNAEQTFEMSLRTRQFEPDAPNFTPRISGIMNVNNGKYSFQMSILKSDNGRPESNCRYTFNYDNPIAGEGRFIHTYMGDGNPLPSFEGEPTLVDVKGGIDEFTSTVWNSLNADEQAIISAAARVFEEKSMEIGVQCMNDYRKQVEESGLNEIYDLTPEEQAEFVKLAMGLYDEMAPGLGEKGLKLIEILKQANGQ